MRNLPEIAFGMSDRDRTAVAKKNIKKGTAVGSRGGAIMVLDAVPQGHRFAFHGGGPEKTLVTGPDRGEIVAP
jgi:hypothetical protein